MSSPNFKHYLDSRYCYCSELNIYPLSILNKKQLQKDFGIKYNLDSCYWCEKKDTLLYFDPILISFNPNYVFCSENCYLDFIHSK